MEITVKRKVYAETYTAGEMYLDGTWFCDTLEDQVRTGEKVPGQTAIPDGRYQVIMSYSAHFQRVMPLLLGVPGFSGVRIHPGNTVADTAGCILVGTSTGKGTLINSRKAYDLLIYEIESEKVDHWINIS